jgi:protein-tyrosine phosphatase
LLAAPDVDELLPGLLLGAGPSKRDCRRLRKAGVTHVVDLRAEADSQSAAWGSQVTVVRVPIVDRTGISSQRLDELGSMINAWLRDGQVVLIHCEGGMGRTAMVACAVLVQRGYSLADAYRLVRDCRPVVAPTDQQMQALLAYEHSSAT